GAEAPEGAPRDAPEGDAEAVAPARRAITHEEGGDALLVAFGGPSPQLSPAARAIRTAPHAMTATPMARAKRSPDGTTRSTVMAAVTTVIQRMSIIPTASSTAMRLPQQR